MAVDSSSTLTQVEAAFDDAASYLENNSTPQARALVTAGGILCRRYAEQATHGPVTIRRDLSLIKELMAQARQFLFDRDEDLQGPKVTHADFTDFRRGQGLEPEPCR